VARTLDRGPRGRWTVLAVGVAAQGAFAAYQQGLPALGPALQARFQIGLTQTGVLFASVSGGVLVTLFAWGLLTDRTSERLVLAAGLGGAAVMLGLAAFAMGFWPLAAALVGAGMLGSCSNAATGRAVMGWFRRAERGTALGIRQMATPLGGGIAALALPALAGDGDLRAAMLALAACALAAAVASAVWIRTPPPDQAGVRPADPVAPDGGEVPPAGPVAAEEGNAPLPDRLAPGQAGAATESPAQAERPAPTRDRRIWRLATGGALLVAGQLSLVSYLTLFLHDRHHWSAGSAAGVLAAVQLGGAAARVLAGRWSDRRGVRIAPMRELAMAGTFLFALTAVLADGPAALLLPVIVVTGVVSMSSNGLAFTATGEIAGQARAGTAMGMQNTALFAAGVIAPIGFGAIAEHVGWPAGFAVLALLAAAGWRLLRPLAPAERRGWRTTPTAQPATPRRG
jgi:sugar phosphate permease